ncbi:MAG: SgcJ/EcaC family oxidoreductase [Verrucomicrobiales bacterium]
MSPRILSSTILTVLASIGLSAPSWAEDSAAKEISIKSADAYVAAFNKGDAAGIAALFTEDAHYTVDSGDLIEGRAEIESRTKAFFSASPDARLGLVVESARFLTPEVILEKGFARVSGTDDPDMTRYSATQVKKDGKWLIAELEETTLPSADPGAEALSSLEWIIGKWKAETEGIDAETEAIWTLDGHFITRTTRVGQDDGGSFVSVEIIGYDPVTDQIRSWTVDNEGGFGSNLWRRDGNKWLIRTKATGPNGGQSSGQHILTVLDEGRFGLESINRIIDGEALPNRDQIVIVRVPESKQPAKK